MVSAPAWRELVRYLTERGLSERRALCVVRMSASAYRYCPAPDRNVDLRERILALAHRHRRYGAGMIYLKLRHRRAGGGTAGASASRPRALYRGRQSRH